MATKYFTCAETAKLIRKALKEAFPGIKFSVKSHTYSGGASINVSWTDGPNEDQVKAVARHFEASYFDGWIDYKGSIYHMMEGQSVCFGADFIFCYRHYTDAAVQKAIDAVYRRFEGNFKRDGIAKPTLSDYYSGELCNARLSGLHQCIAVEIKVALGKHSDRLKVDKSATAAAVFVTHDDGYSRTNGAGISAVPIDL
ncbi:LPD29 domain-containing protein [Xanthomonas oryzae]|uniref:LPD29 domain-containing protein n=1 Tax=Xanthomonas oryzae TaxID=347 RepID=UPI000949FEFF|nr:LPD29 domain-containing protein [Xanthomonas oryzae]QEJ71087.1 hypothetical protein BXO1_025300 [Xanthomonas oryzae pv. oryzae]QIE18176.1 hypothetical protein IXO704_000145 [Xanthomonas oryzae pv. oryzae]RBL11939.1 hypothetical protein BRN33_08880 [Xanthomonas oryzae pv. oryzae]UXV81051.1 hypothetical protein IXO842_023415 [Xanthomonas oryzae pv. oryzae]UXV84851.1 hypothetical protein IXO35_023585 [Xanthomonas oryzae pv. oryzae]